MNSSEILNQVTNIFIDVLEINDLKLSRETSASDIEDWDSLNHILLIVAIEKHFKQKFTSVEIQSWKNVGEMCDAILKKITA